MKRIIFAFAVIACFASCKKEPFAYTGWYSCRTYTVTNSGIKYNDDAEKKYFINFNAYTKYVEKHGVYCEKLK